MPGSRTALFLIVLTLLAASGVHAQSSDTLPGVIVSRQLMESRALRVGDVIRLATRQSGEDARSFRIDGVYEPTADPMRFAQQRLELRFHLPDLQRLLAGAPRHPAPGLRASREIEAEAVTAINVALKDPNDAAAFARDIAARVPGIIARPTSAPNERTTTFIVIERFHLAIAIVTVVGSAVFGILFALASEGLFNRFFQWRYDTTLVFLRITPDVAWRSLAIAVPLGIAASLVASWTLLRQRLLGLLRR